MYILRLMAVIVVITIGAGILLYVITGQRRFLTFAWRLFRYGIVFALIIFALLIVERVAIIPV